MEAPKKTGVLLDDETGDVLLHNNRMVLGNTLYQNQYLLLKTKQGACKADPLRGIGIDDMLGDEGNELYWRKKIREQYAKDGLKVKKLNISQGEIKELIADYE